MDQEVTTARIGKRYVLNTIRERVLLDSDASSNINVGSVANLAMELATVGSYNKAVTVST